MKHGTRYAYNQGCRCDSCRKAHTEYQRARRAKTGNVYERARGAALLRLSHLHRADYLRLLDDEIQARSRMHKASG